MDQVSHEQAASSPLLLDDTVQALQEKIARQLALKTPNIDAAQDLLMAIRIACTVGNEDQIQHLAGRMLESLHGDEKYGYFELHTLATFTMAWDALREYTTRHKVLPASE